MTDLRATLSATVTQLEAATDILAGDGYEGTAELCRKQIAFARAVLSAAQTDPQREREARARELLAHEFSRRGQPSVALAVRAGNLNENGPYAPAVAAMLAFADTTPSDTQGREPSASGVSEAGLREALADLYEVARLVVEASDLAGISGPLGDAARAAIVKARGVA